MKSFVVAASLSTALITAACDGQRYSSPTAPAPVSAHASAWSLVTTRGSETGPGDRCWANYQGQVGASSESLMGVERSDPVLTFIVPFDYDPIGGSRYEGTVAGNDFTVQATAHFANPECGRVVDYTVSGRFSDDGTALMATELQVYRSKAGEEAVNTVAWVAHQN